MYFTGVLSTHFCPLISASVWSGCRLYSRKQLVSCEMKTHKRLKRRLLLISQNKTCTAKTLFSVYRQTVDCQTMIRIKSDLLILQLEKVKYLHLFCSSLSNKYISCFVIVSLLGCLYGWCVCLVCVCVLCCVVLGVCCVLIPVLIMIAGMKGLISSSR